MAGHGECEVQKRALLLWRRVGVHPPHPRVVLQQAVNLELIAVGPGLHLSRCESKKEFRRDPALSQSKVAGQPAAVKLFSSDSQRALIKPGAEKGRHVHGL